MFLLCFIILLLSCVYFYVDVDVEESRAQTMSLWPFLTYKITNTITIY